MDQAIGEQLLVECQYLQTRCMRPRKRMIASCTTNQLTLPNTSLQPLDPLHLKKGNPLARKNWQPFFSGEEGRPPKPPYSAQMGECEWPHGSALEIRRNQKRQANIGIPPLAPISGKNEEAGMTLPTSFFFSPANPVPGLHTSLLCQGSACLRRQRSGCGRSTSTLSSQLARTREQ